MFTNFPGSHLIEDYHKWKKAKKEAGVNNPLAKTFKLLFVIAVTLTLWLLPTTAFGIEGLTLVEQRIIGIFVFATLMWVLEAIPAWSTSLIVVALLLFMTSDSAFTPFKKDPSKCVAVVEAPAAVDSSLVAVADSNLVALVDSPLVAEPGLLVMADTSLVAVADSGMVAAADSAVVAAAAAAATQAPAELGTLLKYQDILHCFADPIIMLFIGGFMLAIAATKYGLDAKIAKVLLKPFGTQSRFVLLGFIVVTGLFSAFISNTATAAMMLAFLAPVLKALPADGKGKIGLALSIPVAANIGGMATPIGTPPNGIVLKYLEEMGMGMGFGEWIAFMGPVTIALLLISWVILLWMFPFKQKTIVLDIPDNSQKGWRTTLVYITFFATIVMWLFDKNLGLKTNAVAMLPVAVFCATGIITKRDLEQISWSVLWMVAGGFALGVALNKSGLAANVVDAIPFATWPPLLVIIGSGLLCYAMANFISHTATAALLVPILAAVAVGLMNDPVSAEALGSVGGVATLLVGVAIASSVGMVLPISTPPNALAYATGLIEQKNMVKVGLIVGAVSLLLGYAVLIVLGTNGML